MEDLEIIIDGIKIENGFTVTFDDRKNALVNGVEVDSSFFVNLAGFLHFNGIASRRQQHPERQPDLSFCNYQHLIKFTPALQERKKHKGVYLIEKVYVGKSTHIRNRIKQHVLSSARDGHYNKALGEFLKNKIRNNETINVYWYDIEPTDKNESSVIKWAFQKGFNLLNVVLYNR